VLDDIRDLSVDFNEGRQNYVLSKMFYCDQKMDRSYLKGLKGSPDSLQEHPQMFDRFLVPAARLGKYFLLKGLSQLVECGMQISEQEREDIADSMFFVLALGDPDKWLTPLSAHQTL